jgi:hypothetical protein
MSPGWQHYNKYKAFKKNNPEEKFQSMKWNAIKVTQEADEVLEREFVGEQQFIPGNALEAFVGQLAKKSIVTEWSTKLSPSVRDQREEEVSEQFEESLEEVAKKSQREQYSMLRLGHFKNMVPPKEILGFDPTNMIMSKEIIKLPETLLKGDVKANPLEKAMSRSGIPTKRKIADWKWTDLGLQNQARYEGWTYAKDDRESLRRILRFSARLQSYCKQWLAALMWIEFQEDTHSLTTIDCEPIPIGSSECTTLENRVAVSYEGHHFTVDVDEYVELTFWSREVEQPDGTLPVEKEGGILWGVGRLINFVAYAKYMYGVDTNLGMAYASYADFSAESENRTRKEIAQGLLKARIMNIRLSCLVMLKNNHLDELLNEDIISAETCTLVEHLKDMGWVDLMESVNQRFNLMGDSETRQLTIAEDPISKHIRMKWNEYFFQWAPEENTEVESEEEFDLDMAGFEDLELEQVFENTQIEIEEDLEDGAQGYDSEAEEQARRDFLRDERLLAKAETARDKEIAEVYAESHTQVTDDVFEKTKSFIDTFFAGMSERNHAPGGAPMPRWLKPFDPGIDR